MAVSFLTFHGIGSSNNHSMSNQPGFKWVQVESVVVMHIDMNAVGAIACRQAYSPILSDKEWDLKGWNDPFYAKFSPSHLSKNNLAPLKYYLFSVKASSLHD